ncbi:BTAD domain-containing putative transcriptional regulator [Streptomyces sp. NPDC050658]|uniref:AfsR/SARP family transcriptional regulator n=1 Tax=unclassified Streptomyces TaxID=2593676 RepID=UPI0034364B16
MRFQVLGNFEVLAGDHIRTPSAPKLRKTLALLILRHNQVVSTKELIDELWGMRPPSKAVRAVHTYIYELRRALEEPQGLTSPCHLLTRPNGYLVQLPCGAVDLNSFRTLVKDGSEALSAGNPARAGRLLARSLSLWRGTALANVDCGELLEPHAAELEESRMRALELRIEADFQLGRHQQLTAELKALAAAMPLHEGVYAKLILALYRSNRRGEALKVFQDLRRHLIRELGLEPGPELQRLQQAVLAADSTLDPPAAPEPRGPAPARWTAVGPPAQLPRDSVDFVGREKVVEELAGELRRGSGDTAMPLVSLIGMPGVGKTATAVHLAHSVRREYPDGQLFLSLRGTRAVPLTAMDGTEQILRGIGVPTDELPTTLAGRISMFRTWSSGRRVLLVLDDADSVAQVDPLLPGGTGCAVLITGRSRLYGLPGARSVRLGPLALRAGVELLARHVGPERIAAEPEAAQGLVRFVEGLPLAVNFLGERLAALPTLQVATVLEGIESAKGVCGLSELAAVGLDLYGRFEASFSRLDEETRTMALRLALMPRRRFDVGQAARTLGVGSAVAELLLMRLADASLLDAAGPDGAAADQRTYWFPELVREYATERGSERALRALPPVDSGAEGRFREESRR